jgi:hypothetical protein
MLRIQLKFFLCILIAIFILALAFKYPIFPDEITNIFLVGRNNFQSIEKLWLMPACLVDKIYIPQPLTYIYSISQALYSTAFSPRALRAISILLSITLIFTWARLVISNGDRANLKILLLIFIWPLIFINSFVYLRPEKFFLIFLIFSLFINYRHTKSLIINFLYIVVTLLMLINHPKGFYFLPIFFVTYCKIFEFRPKEIFLNSVLLVFGGLCTYQIYVLSASTWPCNSVDFVRDFIKIYAVNPAQVLIDPLDFLRQILAANDLHKTERAISQLMLRANYEISYFPNVIDNQLFSYVASTPIAIILIASIYCLAIRLPKTNDKLFCFVYLCSVLCSYLLGANKSPYDISFTVIAVLLIIPFVNGIKIHVPKFIIAFYILFAIYGYISIAKQVFSGWVGPGLQIVEPINFDEINAKVKKYLNRYDYFIYEDNTAFLFKGNKNQYPITYMMNLATRDNNLIKRNIAQKRFLYVGRCAYTNVMRSIQDDVKIETFEVFKVDGIPDAVCIAEITTD